MKKLFVITLAALMLFSACGKKEEEKPTAQDEPKTPSASGPAELPASNTYIPEIAKVSKTDIPEEPRQKTVRIIAAGDNLLHNVISFDAEIPGGGYDFSPVYEHIAPIAKSGDIAFINEEIMLTGGVSGYPRMEAPAEVADALIGAGFNVINLATNHTLDKGEAGLAKCLENVKKRSFDAVLGAFATEDEAKTLALVEKNGITFGFLSYTYDMNGYTLSEGNEWKIAVIDEPKMVRDMRAIRPLCDYLIVSMHWGVEYQHEVAKYQRHLAQLLCDYGTDLIIGTHPHVIEPMETITSTNGKRTTLCAWSLGNFVSNQHKLPTMLGGMIDVTLTFDTEKNLVSTQAGIIPTVTHYGAGAKGFKIYPLSEYTDELAAQHGIKDYAEPLTLSYLNELATSVLGDAMMQ